jgi:hypothetical protein
MAAKDRHPVVIAWAVDNARAREAFRTGKGPVVWSFNQQDHRAFRILSSIFFEIEKHGVVPGSFGHPEFHFVSEKIMYEGLIEPIDRNSRSPSAKLRFTVANPCPDASIPTDWSDGDAPLEDSIPEIVAWTLVIVRSAARAFRESEKSSIEATLFNSLERLRELNDPAASGVAARYDPRTFQTLIMMAERHRSAVLVRRLLHSLSRRTINGSAIVADQTLDDWMRWAATMADEYDPLNQGAEKVFQELVKP